MRANLIFCTQLTPFLHAKNESIIYPGQKTYGKGQKAHWDTTGMSTRY